ncbi:MAG TPA: UDP-N-acetylmuramoyl-L-alanyl-D-glutamate--2,6-diaminopimelate ligase [Sediminibacterium sp.]|nr:UDP-N-acetylmuramoyl-L-alanyl-D-glutamate--2,6-diaminopimelate ligase [Sediminibacterium sp.]
MPVLKDILYRVHLREVIGSTDREITAIVIDSRQVQAGCVFVAIRGAQADGHRFMDAAAEAGALAIVCEIMPVTRKEGVTYLLVNNTQEAVAWMAHHFYGEPSRYLKLTGVTGTNGKTTIATVLFKLFTQLGYHCGLISTVQNQIGDIIVPATHTTPDAVSLNARLRQMQESGCTHVFMECSSHAIHQHRITGLHFAGGIFSNITHDHLDYHKTFDEYIRVKKSFFDHLPAGSFAISNLDDKRGEVMLQNTAAHKYFYSLKTPADFKGKILENSLTGLVMLVNERQVHFRLIGEFNAYNLLAVYGAGICLGEDAEQLLTALSLLTGAEGRFDYQVSSQLIIGIVDYAHTPDALENVLVTIRKLRKGHEQIITVVGCGGDRDKTKRPVMAQTACDLSDRVILTSDNPRTEDPQAILQDMQEGLTSAARRKYIVVPDRKEAIKTAVSFAHKEDIILIAGKGHEKYQDIAGVKHPFDDKAIVKEMFALLGK